MSRLRGYQTDFYAGFARIRGRERRLRRAAKIRWALTEFGQADLSRLVCLDVGCSAGVITAQLAPLCRRTVGLDYDRGALAAIAPADRAAADFLRGDAMSLPLADDSVDLIVCAQVYEHMPADRPLFAEIYRVLRPGGICFFSGPNWLFPLEPHFFLPFLHWLPEGWADRYLQLAGKGDHYYERSRTWWDLRRCLQRFQIQDITIDVLFEFYLRGGKGPASLLKLAPRPLWRLLLPLFPNFNWILRKA